MEQNTENMEKVKEAIAQADKVRLAGDLKEGVELNYTSLDGNSYQGLVVFKRPTMKDYMRMGALKSEYLRQAGIVDIGLVDNTIKQMAQALATLKVVMVKMPEWLLDPEKLEEIDVIYHVYDKYEEWDNSFRKRGKAEPTADSTNA